MRRRQTLALAAGALACAAGRPRAQDASRPRRIAMLRWDSPASGMVAVDQLRQRLAALGWIEGRTIEIDVGFAEGDPGRADALVGAMLSRGAEIIVAASTPAVRAAVNATGTVPIVMAPAADPVANGYVASLARPGGNVTGVTLGGPELSAKRVELLREMLPAVARIAFLGSSRDPAGPIFAAETAAGASAFGLGFASFFVNDIGELRASFAAVAASGAQALVVQPIFVFQRDEIAALALHHGLPTVAELRPMAEAGCLMTYGTAQDWGIQGAAPFVDRILRGARPADLPVERPTRVELVVNLRTARALDLTIPPSILARADELIE